MTSCACDTQEEELMEICDTISDLKSDLNNIKQSQERFERKQFRNQNSVINTKMYLDRE